MAHIKNINITGAFNITNRGLALTTELDYDLEHSKFITWPLYVLCLTINLSSMTLLMIVA